MAAEGDANSVVVGVNRFADLKSVGNAYRERRTVDLRIENEETDIIRRVIDFASGMVYATGGEMTKVGDRRFLLVPGPPISAPPSPPSTPPADGAGDREPRHPRPTSGAGAMEVALPEPEEGFTVVVGSVRA